MKERDHFEDLSFDLRIILKRVLKKYTGRSWSELISVMTGTSGHLLRTQQRNFQFSKMWEHD